MSEDKPFARFVPDGFGLLLPKGYGLLYVGVRDEPIGTLHKDAAGKLVETINAAVAAERRDAAEKALRGLAAMYFAEQQSPCAMPVYLHRDEIVRRILARADAVARGES